MKKVILKNNKKPERIKINETINISLKIDKTELEKINKYCKENRIYRSQFIRESISNNIQKNN